MKYAAITRVLSDIRNLLKCVKCNSSLLLIELNVKNFMKSNERIYVHLICPKCDYKHYFEQLSPGVWGLIESSGLEGSK